MHGNLAHFQIWPDCLRFSKPKEVSFMLSINIQLTDCAPAKEPHSHTKQEKDAACDTAK